MRTRIIVPLRLLDLVKNSHAYVAYSGAYDYRFLLHCSSPIYCIHFEGAQSRHVERRRDIPCAWGASLGPIM